MTECNHEIGDISHVDSAGYVRFGQRLFLWGECECGAPTIIHTTIDKVEVDTVGSISTSKSEGTE